MAAVGIVSPTDEEDPMSMQPRSLGQKAHDNRLRLVCRHMLTSAGVRMILFPTYQRFMRCADRLRNRCPHW